MPEPPSLVKYPRTPHLAGSRLQPGDEDLESVPFQKLAGRHLVIEEKVDGANAAISFDEKGNLWLQSRGHYLTGGPRERHFSLFKQWANRHAAAFWEVLGDRYTLYGEWVYARHTLFYTHLPHYFLEFDVLDREAGGFLSTSRRRDLLGSAPMESVPVLHEGTLQVPSSMTGMIGHSAYIEKGHLQTLREVCESRGLDPEQALRETDPEVLMEGLYVKIEENGQVVERLKFIRPSFLTAVQESGSHWLDRPIIPNQLAPGAPFFE